MSPRELASWARVAQETFGRFPPALAKYALQIQALTEGLKPAFLATVRVDDLRECLAHLKDVGMCVHVQSVRNSELLFCQASSGDRQQLRQKQWYRLFVAKKNFLALSVGKIANSADLGVALGYPICCVSAAITRDKYVRDVRTGTRQANLHAAAVAASERAHFACNAFFHELDVAWNAPPSLLPHYPCRLDCPESVRMGKQMLELCRQFWPAWEPQLFKLLQSPTFYWRDIEWDVEYLSEACGVVLVDAEMSSDRRTWKARSFGLRLGSGLTPNARLPVDPDRVTIGPTGIYILSHSGSESLVPFEGVGRPVLIHWNEGTLTRL